VAVSGSVGLELLYRHKPTVVIYRQTAFHLAVASFLKKAKYISIVNLIAGQELFPEYLMLNCRGEEIASHIVGWLDNPSSYDNLSMQLQELCRQVAVPGACDRAAELLLEKIESRLPLSRKAA
jgi:lipid-A-disaccharide synthase